MDTKFKCTKCGQIGSVGRCCGLDTRIPLNDEARAEIDGLVSKTPRTDAEAQDSDFCVPKDGQEWVDASFARELEQELAEARAVLDGFVKMFTDTDRYPDPETATTGLRMLFPRAKAALEAAERTKE